MNYAHEVLDRDYPNTRQTILHMYNWSDGSVSYYPFSDPQEPDKWTVAIFRCKPKDLAPPTEVFHWSEEEIINRMKIAYPLHYKNLVEYADFPYFRGIGDSNKLDYAIALIKTQGGRGYMNG